MLSYPDLFLSVSACIIYMGLIKKWFASTWEALTHSFRSPSRLIWFVIHFKTFIHASIFVILWRCGSFWETLSELPPYIATLISEYVEAYYCTTVTGRLGSK
jgi:hypothetical protein